jgi:hypothetical protein
MARSRACFVRAADRDIYCPAKIFLPEPGPRQENSLSLGTSVAHRSRFYDYRLGGTQNSAVVGAAR